MTAFVFAVANQKGGVGKTTTSVNAAAALARLGHRVLLADLDPQGNATMGSGINKQDLTSSVYQILLGELSIPQGLVRSEIGGYDVLAANRDLAGAEIELVDLDDRERRLLNALKQVANDYDFVIIDCPHLCHCLR